MSSAATASAIGSYTTIRQLGSGGMGEIFLAHDASLGRDVAIKLLPEHLARETENLFRLQQEARAASSLNHPNIITIYEIGQHDSGAFMAMEYVDGNTLRDLLVGGPIPVRKALQIGAQIADGLAAAHKRGLVHRDLKPENVMITSDGVVKILDFGLAKVEGPNAQGVTDPGTIVGSYGYMSPEQARAGEVDYRSDQFSLGAILYEMLTGRRAFDGASGVETLFMIVRDEPVPLSVAAAHVPAPVRWVVDRCLSKDADDRYVSTRDLARELQYIRDHFSEAGIPTPIKDEQTVAQKMRRVWPLAAAIAAALAIGSVATAIVRRPAPRAITAERYLTYSGNDFSPDGSTVLYQHAEQGKPAALWKVPVVGGEAR
ncbi:MAG TPA: serine/threonine-protein kinase, partial [Thermoanaerobaculia bacterium]